MPNFEAHILLSFSLLKGATSTVGRLERDFQRKLIGAIYERFPGCFVMKNDPTYIQGIPDLVILYKHRWAALEVKKDAISAEPRHLQPNQETYVALLNDMSYAAFVYPENVEEVLNDLQQSLGA